MRRSSDLGKSTNNDLCKAEEAIMDLEIKDRLMLRSGEAQLPSRTPWISLRVRTKIS